MSKRKIEFVAPCKLGREQYEIGDSKSFPTAQADQYVALGWAKDPDTGEQGDLVPGVQSLDVQDVSTPSS